MCPISLFALITLGKWGFVYISDRNTNINFQTSEIIWYKFPMDKWSDVQKSYF